MLVFVMGWIRTSASIGHTPKCAQNDWQRLYCDSGQRSNFLQSNGYGNLSNFLLSNGYGNLGNFRNGRHYRRRCMRADHHVRRWAFRFRLNRQRWNLYKGIREESKDLRASLTKVESFRN